MRIDVTSMFFNSKIEGQTATPAWGTSIGQSKSRDCRIDDFRKEVVEMVIGMTYKSVADLSKLDVSKGSDTREIVTCSVFEDVYINKKKIENTQYVLLLVREHSKSHDGRLIISYAPYIKYNGIENQSCIDLMQKELGCTPEGCWFVYDISIKNQSELYFSAVVVNASAPMVYSNSVKSKNRSEEWKALIPADGVLQETLSEPLQQIFYGAPGTGKSSKAKKDVNKILEDNYITNEKEKEKHIFRTTFHPDSDYASFVGCYKPKSRKKNLISGSGGDEAQLLQCFLDSNSDEYKGKNKARYLYEALIHTKDIRGLGLDAQTVADKLIEKNFSGCAYTTEANCMYNIYDWLKEDGYIVDNIISYEFCPQCFTNAYVAAWNDLDNPYFLIIEEINRGNCAQVFGDLFQLLDRKNDGTSDYTIKVDNDLYEYLEENLTNKDGIKNGELCLPPNLFIWATMNTSDQSLFPMDSAFKRRWEWEYIPICYDKTTQDGNENKAYYFKITINGRNFSWINFLRVVNLLVKDATDSEDKQMGNFFIKHDVEEKEFISKVMYYLWSEVCKDNFGSRQNFFRKDDDKEFSFNELFDDKDHQLLLSFMERLQKEADVRDELKDKNIKIEKNDSANNTTETSEEV